MERSGSRDQSIKSLTEDLQKSDFASICIPPPKINYREEIVFFFFNAMMETIVDSWESEEFDTVESIPSADVIVTSKPYRQVCDEDLSSGSVVSVHNSNINFTDKKDATSESGVISATVSKGKVGNKSSSKLKRNSTSSKRKSSVKQNEEVEKPRESVDKTWIIPRTDETVTIKFRNGNMYQGQISGKLMHGQGTFIWEDGTQYVGEFSQGKLTGKGRMTFSDTSWYEGEFLKGYRHGSGAMLEARNDTIYNGQWSAGERNGFGWHLYDPDNWYEGQWKNDRMKGEGLRQYPSGARYYGHWFESQRHGSGCAVMYNNDFYNGDWFEGKRKGYGEYTWNSFFNKSFTFPIENKYCGAWNKNVRHGVGVVSFGMEGGAKYAGCFEQNEKHGPGILLCENGVTVESNPLFINDKPVHLTESGSFNFGEDYGTITPADANNEAGTKSELFYTETNDSAPNSSLVTISKLASETHPRRSSTYMSSFYIPPQRRPSTLNMINKQIRLTSIELDKSTIANIEMCKIKFPSIKENFLSFPIPVNSPSEHISIGFYIQEVLQKYETVSTNYEHFDNKDCSSEESLNKSNFPAKISTFRIMDSPQPFKKLNTCDETPSVKDDLQIQTDRRELQNNEEKWLRRAITLHLPELRNIYQRYASLTCLRNLPFKAMLIRLFLWQLYRDCMIPEKGLSLIETDKILMENSDTQIEPGHNPFEIIYFWQFLHSLISVAWKLYGSSCMTFLQDGVLRTAFNRFLQNDIYPNIGQHKGCVLYDYLDLLPIDCVYKWYSTWVEPISALEFLQYSCTVKRLDPPSYYQAPENAETPFIPMGINAVPVGNNLLYLEDESPAVQTEPSAEKVKAFDSDPFRFKLHFLRKLGARRVLSCLKEICPTVVKDNEIVDLKYQMTFLEFYEVVLMCTQTLVDIDERERKKELERQAEEERILLEDLHSPSLASDFDTRKQDRSKRNSVKKGRKSV